MNTIHAIIESLEGNYSAYIDGLDGVVATGATIEEIESHLKEAVDVFVESCRELGCEVPEALQGEYQIAFTMDVKSLLNLYRKIFTKAGLERLTGINQKQLWHYANGTSVPRTAQVRKIENALHRLGSELLAVHFS